MYAQIGTYTVRLTVKDDSGANGTATKEITVVNKPPVAKFTFTPTNPTTDDEVKFTDESVDDDGEIVFWRWDFGDYTGSTFKNPIHKYTTPGTYTVTLTIKDNNDAEDAISQVIKIMESQKNEEPIADFTYSPTKPTIDDTILFKDKSTDSDGSIVEWLWDFGDGTKSTKQNPKHKYKKPGSYTVTLTVKDNKNAVNVVKKTIKIYKSDAGGGDTGDDASDTPSKPEKVNVGLPVGILVGIGIVVGIVLVFIILFLLIALSKRRKAKYYPYQYPLTAPQYPAITQPAFARPPSPTYSFSADTKTCKRCGASNEKWRLSCSICKSNLG
jgi:PKD repeat protein